MWVVPKVFVDGMLGVGLLDHRILVFGVGMTFVVSMLWLESSRHSVVAFGWWFEGLGWCGIYSICL